MSVYLFKMEGETKIAGVRTTATYVFRADQERAVQVLTKIMNENDEELAARSGDVYLFQMKGETKIAGVKTTATYVFRADEERAAQVLTKIMLPSETSSNMGYYLAKEVPTGGHITGTDLIQILPKIGESINEILIDKGDINDYYPVVGMNDMPFDLIDYLLDLMIENLSYDGDTPDDPYYFDSWQIANNIIEDAEIFPQDILLMRMR